MQNFYFAPGFRWLIACFAPPGHLGSFSFTLNSIIQFDLRRKTGILHYGKNRSYFEKIWNFLIVKFLIVTLEHAVVIGIVVSPLILSGWVLNLTFRFWFQLCHILHYKWFYFWAPQEVLPKMTQIAIVESENRKTGQIVSSLKFTMK